MPTSSKAATIGFGAAMYSLLLLTSLCLSGQAVGQAAGDQPGLGQGLPQWSGFGGGQQPTQGGNTGGIGTGGLAADVGATGDVRFQQNNPGQNNLGQQQLGQQTGQFAAAYGGVGGGINTGAAGSMNTGAGAGLGGAGTGSFGQINQPTNFGQMNQPLFPQQQQQVPGRQGGMEGGMQSGGLGHMNQNNIPNPAQPATAEWQAPLHSSMIVPGQGEGGNTANANMNGNVNPAAANHNGNVNVGATFSDRDGYADPTTATNAPRIGSWQNPRIFMRHNGTLLTFGADEGPSLFAEHSAGTPQADAFAFQTAAVGAQDVNSAVNNHDCNVLYLRRTDQPLDSHGQPLPLGKFKGIFTDATDLVPYGKSRPPFFYLDQGQYLRNVNHKQGIGQKMGKRRVSFLFPPVDRITDDVMYTMLMEAREAFPNDVYFDVNADTRREAFENYSFSVLFSMSPDDVASPTLLDCVAYGTVPGLIWGMWGEAPEQQAKNGNAAQGKLGNANAANMADSNTPLSIHSEGIKKHYMEYCYYFKYAVAKFRYPGFTPQSAHMHLTEWAPDDAVFVMQSSLKLVQDYFFLRYRLPFFGNLKLHATAVCKEQEQSHVAPFVFVGILSAKQNFNKRQAMRDTWLKVLEAEIPHRDDPEMQAIRGNDQLPNIRSAYKFFVNRVAAEEHDREDMDWLLRGEAELKKDIVFVDVPREYPIGNQGMAAFQWIANYTDATYVMKLDDDIYLRPVPFFQELAKEQRSMLYLGTFDYSGDVVRDPTNNHYLAEANYDFDVFPPYARGAGLVISLDLIREFVAMDRRKQLRRLRIEDVSYGFYLNQAAVANRTGVSIQDNYEEQYAMDAKCCTEETHPNHCWSPLTIKSQLIHHMSPEQQVCMFKADLASGMYEKSPHQFGEMQKARPTATDQLKHTWRHNFGGERKDESVPDFDVFVNGQWFEDFAKGKRQLPELCHCVHTPEPIPNHPSPFAGRRTTPDEGRRVLPGMTGAF